MQSIWQRGDIKRQVERQLQRHRPGSATTAVGATRTDSIASENATEEPGGNNELPPSPTSTEGTHVDPEKEQDGSLFTNEHGKLRFH